MQDDYYQNTLYPFQDKVLETIGKLPVGFYLTGGTALSRAYIHHRYSRINQIIPDILDGNMNSLCK